MSRCIDAEALIDGYRHMGYDPSEHPEESYMEGWCKGFNSAVDHCIHHAIHAPTIDPERKKGRWIKLYQGNYKCSVCGDWWGSDDNDIIKEFLFCPNCGARMEGAEDDKSRNHKV